MAQTRARTAYRSSPPPSRTKKENRSSSSSSKIIVTTVVVIWAFLGLAAFIMSILCFGRSGTTGQHIAGLLLALFFGPFYWIFYYYAPDYCTKFIGTVNKFNNRINNNRRRYN